MSEQLPRWVLSPRDRCSHVLDAQAGAEGVMVARCGQRMAATVDVTPAPAEGGAMCTPCRAWLVADSLGAPVHGRREQA